MSGAGRSERSLECGMLHEELVERRERGPVLIEEDVSGGELFNIFRISMIEKGRSICTPPRRFLSVRSSIGDLNGARGSLRLCHRLSPVFVQCHCSEGSGRGKKGSSPGDTVRTPPQLQRKTLSPWFPGREDSISDGNAWCSQIDSTWSTIVTELNEDREGDLTAYATITLTQLIKVSRSAYSYDLSFPRAFSRCQSDSPYTDVLWLAVFPPPRRFSLNVQSSSGQGLLCCSE